MEPSSTLFTPNLLIITNLLSLNIDTLSSLHGKCLAPEKMDKKPCKIMWDVPWEELMTVELAKAGCTVPSHLILHLKQFRRSEVFVRVIKCTVENESEGGEVQAVRICSTVRKMWKAYQSHMKSLTLRVRFCKWMQLYFGDPHM